MESNKDKQKRIELYLQKIDSIPSLPSLVIEIIKLIDNPMSSTHQIEELFLRDQGLSLKALRLANSAYYAIPGGAKTVGRAITFLGFNSIKQLVISTSVFGAFKKLDCPPTFSMIEFWKHSMGTAIAAEVLAKHLKLAAPEEVFICGLTHDMGKLVLLMVDKENFLNTCILAKEKGLSFYQAEIATEAPLHTYWGQVLAKKWQLPELITATIKDHHSTNPKLRSSADPEINRIIDLIFIANQAVHYFNYGNSGYDNKPIINSEVLLRLGLKLGENEEWMRAVKEALSHADSMTQDLVRSYD